MTQDEITEMAREASSMARLPWNGEWIFRSEKELMAFASLVAAKEREAVAQLIETTEWWKAPQWQSALCPITKGAIADAIRARGQKEGA